MVERILKMLEQFLISNQTLKLNETFKVYLKVLSIEHMKYKKNIKESKKSKKIRRKHFGARIHATKKYNYFWALDVPDSYPNEPSKNIFKDKCLLTSTILALLQNQFYKSNRTDKRFLHVQNINSTSMTKQNHAGNILLKELKELFQKTKLLENGPYILESTVKTLSKIYGCQFFIFDGLDNSNKIIFQFPDKYDDTLIPIYLYQPNDSRNHLVFIRHLNSYFKANVKVCFPCKQIFLTYNYKHLCSQKKSCFSCRRFFCEKETYLHEKLITLFCDKNITDEMSFLCSLCNVTCYSKHCFKGHKLICSGNGTFGYKCLKCNKFTYRHGSLNGTDIKNQHICGQLKNCKFCREDQETDHLCKLKKESIFYQWPKLAFINFEQFPGFCAECCAVQKNDKRAFCTSHQNTFVQESEPLLIIVHCEENKTGSFSKYIFSHFLEEPLLTVERNSFLYKYKEETQNKIISDLNKKKSQDFVRNLQNLQERKNHFLLIDKLLQTITTQSWQNTTFICQDEDSNTFMTLLNAFIRNGFCPEIVRNGRHIMVMEIKPLGLRFLSSKSYFEGNEFQIAKQYNLKFDYTFFPQKFFQSQNILYQGEIPDLSYFVSNLDSPDVHQQKIDYVNNFREQNYVWNFQKELLQYAELKNLLLMLCSLHFIEECLRFQNQIKSLIQDSKDLTLHPFSYPLCSLSGFSYKLFKIYFLNKFDIYVVKNEFGVNCKNVSKIEYEWASFMEFKENDKCFLSAFNNEIGQKYFKEAVPDLYSPVTKQAYFFNGCVFHGHYENCLINKNATQETKNPFGIAYKKLNEDFENKISNLLLNNESEIDEVIYQWECQYKKLRETDAVLQDFLKSNFISHPLIRLRPRSCVRGALFDVYALRWSQVLFPNENLFFLDVNGLYSYCAINFKFMIGKYKVLIGKDLKLLQINNQQFYFNNNKIMGSILLTILAPQTLFFPYLMYRTKEGKTINTLCCKCSETRQIRCNHLPSERAITACFMISEIEFALTLGYEIIAIYECHVYQHSDFILKPFIQYLNYFKTKYSDCFKSCKSNSEKQDYCNFLNKKMDLTEPFMLKVNEISPNLQKRTFYKLMSNALFGKLEQKNDKSQTRFVNKQSDLEDIFFSENKIQDLTCINNEICQVQVSQNELKLPPNRKSNCYIGAQVTAFARQIIYTHLQTLNNVNATIYQIDCDSIIFALPKQTNIPLQISDAVGDFKFELKGNIINFYSLGPKNYTLTFEKDGKCETISKVRGLSLNNSLNKNVFNDELFKLYIDQFLQNHPAKMLINQYRIKGNFKRLKVSSELEQITFRNDVSNRRIVDSKTLNYKTIPYGFKEKE